MKINVLNEETINKISAGEVVERPQNVVKELVENSLDAGASGIDIEIEGAGRRLIRVRDDGSGMSREDLTLAVTRHATSKIKAFEDIYSTKTMGFRGEALPSIAAVSHLNIMSQERGSGSGWQIKLSGSKFVQSKAWAGSVGTIVEAAGLFFNTPAREKFLKSDVTERNHIAKIVEELALANPSAGFRFLSEKRKVIDAAKAGKKIERIADILGDDFANRLISFEIKHPKIQIECFVTEAQKAMPTRNFQYLFVNKRPVILGRNITHAVYEAFRENLEISKHPGILIYMEIDPSAIDVNIHPTKREIRFSNEREIHDLLYREVKNRIAKPLSIFVDDSVEKFLASGSSHRKVEEPRNEYKITAKEKVEIERKVEGFEFSGGFDAVAHGQVFGLYVLASKNKELMIIDQHAAQERIKYEEYMSELSSKNIPIQGLLIPRTFDLPSSRADILKESLELLREAGWEIEEFGKNAFRISALPGVLGNEKDVEEILNAVIDALDEERILTRLERIEAIIMSACKASIKRGDRIAQSEMAKLIADLFKCKAPYTCPHGRPTLLKMSKEELEKHFKRS